MANVPANLKYSNDHEWCRVEGDVAVIGITDYAQSQLGDIVFVDVPTVGENIEANEVFGSIEAVKTVSDAFSPVSGEWWCNLLCIDLCIYFVFLLQKTKK